MEWSRVKSILICVFILVNLFLIKVYFDGNSGGRTVDQNTIVNAAAVLRINNIFIDETNVPDKADDVLVFETSNKYESPQKFLDSVNGGNLFSDIQTDSSSFSCTVNAQSIKEAIKLLKKSGAFDGIKYEKISSKGKTEFFAMFNNLRVLDSSLLLEEKDGLIKFSGKNWLGGSFQSNGYSVVKTAPEALLAFAAATSFTDSAPAEITAMTKGYVLGNRDGQIQTVTAVPVWSLTVTDGAIYYIDMRNGDLIN